jgi:hypothetical protein
VVVDAAELVGEGVHDADPPDRDHRRGGHARVVASTLLACGQTVAAFYDDDESMWGKTFSDITVAGPISALTENGVSHAIIGIGNNAVRKRVAEQLDVEWVTAVHPFSWVHPGVRLGPGTLVCACAIIEPGAQVGAHVLLNTKASVDHDTSVGDFVHIAVAHLAGGAAVDEGVSSRWGASCCRACVWAPGLPRARSRS